MNIDNGTQVIAQDTIVYIFPKATNHVYKIGKTALVAILFRLLKKIDLTDDITD